MWRNYSGWLRDARTSYERELSRTRASLSASGIRAGTDAWTQGLASVERDYQKRLTEIRGGHTAKELRRFSRSLMPRVQHRIDPDTGEAIRETPEDRYGAAGRTEFERRFGPDFAAEGWEQRVAGRYGIGGEPTQSAEQASMEKAKAAASGGRALAASMAGAKRQEDETPWTWGM